MAIHFINLSWAEIGIVESTSFVLSFLQKGDEPIEQAVERYVIGYMAFWGIVFVKNNLIHSRPNETTMEAGKEKIRQYVARHPPATPLPRFYITLLNQPHIAGDAYGFSDVFCL
ncbi:hypothetical protein [uncultured Bacteroides sp.]|uniref:hypothetical protein n=1 Tax=uncultured Bacteroides sp. TaxID=162156 RepID=UPI0025EDAB36|nr:hypothetical protein [uncultured Bacteroides sp.]